MKPPVAEHVEIEDYYKKVNPYSKLGQTVIYSYSPHPLLAEP